MRSRIKGKKTLLVVGDSAAMVVASLCAIALGHWAGFSYRNVFTYNAGLLTLILSTLLIFFIIDTYSINRIPLRFIRQSLLIVTGLCLSAILTTFTFFFFRDAVPRAVFILYYLLAAILIIGLRYFLTLRAQATISNLLLIGDGERSKITADTIGSMSHLRLKVVGLLSDDPASPDLSLCPRLGGIAELHQVVKRHKIDHLILATGSISDELGRQLVECMQNKLKVSSFTDVIEDLSGQIPVKFLNDNWFILKLSSYDKRNFWYVKRYMDIGIAVAGIILVFPLLLLAALLVKLDSAGPVFYFQLRVGRDGIPFSIWKLRTMTVEENGDEFKWTEVNDSRITRVGKWLRKLRFDEVPQLMNVLKGEMSLIGPRPETVSMVEKCVEAIPYYFERHMVSPGITGWAQINYRYGNSIEDTFQKLMYDFYYIKNRGAMLDAIIFLRTIRTVLTGKGAM